MTLEPPSARSAGFTLVEILVALAIVALGMSAVLSALSSAADSTSYLRDKTLAQWIALNRITEQRLSAQRPGEGKTEGEVEFAGRRWRWEQEVEEIEIPGVFRIDVRVRPADLGARNEQSWVTTVSGAVGDAVAPPQVRTPWAAAPRGGEMRNPGGRDDQESGADPDAAPPAQNPATQ